MASKGVATAMLTVNRNSSRAAGSLRRARMTIAPITRASRPPSVQGTKSGATPGQASRDWSTSGTDSSCCPAARRTIRVVSSLGAGW